MLVLQSIAFAADLHDVGMVQQPIQHCRGQRLVIGKGAGPLSERQVADQDHAASFVAPGHHIEEQVGFLSAEWQIADLIDYQ